LKKYLIPLSIILTIISIYIFGRPLFHNLIIKSKGKQTVQSINNNLSEDVYKSLRPQLSDIGLQQFPEKIAILAFKEEEILELWVHSNNTIKFLKRYPFTKSSGVLGPKLKEGDKQIPEGIYNIEYLNPNSNYYLSLKVNYPNTFDKAKARLDGRTNIGSDIFIHGKNVTVGCIPLGDIAIEEIFILASHAIDNNIEVVISPRDFRVNKTYPDIQSVTWTKELYDLINNRLQVYQ
jgi:murein L,D-transpeptidase YafK